MVKVNYIETPVYQGPSPHKYGIKPLPLKSLEEAKYIMLESGAHIIIKRVESNEVKVTVNIANYFRAEDLEEAADLFLQIAQDLRNNP